jgi:hypothetical protein
MYPHTEQQHQNLVTDKSYKNKFTLEEINLSLPTTA